MAAKYPIVLVHGLLGFVKVLGFPGFFGIQEALEKEGHTVFVPTLSSANSSEVRGEQLIKEIKLILSETGAEKVNLIGYSQGALTSRYVASKYPQYVASVTSVCGPNQGSEIADLLEKIFASNGIVRNVMVFIFNLLGGLFSYLSGGSGYPQDFMAALKELTTEGAKKFNKEYGAGVPDIWGGEGNYVENNIYYFSWSGIIKVGIFEQGLNLLDYTHHILVLLSKFFRHEKENDGLVGRYSSHLGRVIRSDYNMDHMDAINQFAGLTPPETDSIKIFTEHAELLGSSGL